MEVLMGKSSINGPFSMAMLNNQMVYIYMYMVGDFKHILFSFIFHNIWDNPSH
jgi:hypothetical protein